MTTSTLPPPLSTPPTVESLEALLTGLAEPRFRVAPVPPLPVPAVLPSAMSPAPAAATVPAPPVARPRWRVEHVPSGVPVHLSVGDHLGEAELRRLRDELADVHPDAPLFPPPTGDPLPGPAAGAPEGTPVRARGRRLAVAAVAVATAATAAAARGLGVELPLP